MKIVNNKNPLLNKPLAFMENLDLLELQDIADQLFSFIDKNGGAGLAASQVGIDKRMFVVKYNDYQQTFINPKIVWESERNLSLEEGCLTYPDLFMEVKRPDATRLNFIDYNGDKIEEKLFMGITNRVIQHEYDHMEGKFFWDHLSKVQLDRWKKKIKKAGF